MSLFQIADLPIELSFAASQHNGLWLIPSFKLFMIKENAMEKQHALFHFYIDDSIVPIEKSQRERIRDFDTGNGITTVDQLANGGYQFITKDIKGRDCSLLITDKDFSYFRCALNGTYNMRSFGLNSALMLAFSYSGASQQALMVHASVVRQDGIGYAFIAKSGTGKSTQVSMWLRYLPNCDLMNDDNPIIRIVNGKAYIFGSPWSGKTPCYRNIKAPLGAITRIDRAKENSIERLTPVQAFASVLPSVSSMKWANKLYDATCDNVSKIVETTNIFTLHCLPDKASAEICNKAIKI